MSTVHDDRKKHIFRKQKIEYMAMKKSLHRINKEPILMKPNETSR